MRLRAPEGSVLFFNSGNEQMDQAVYKMLECAMRDDMAGVIACVPYVKAALADLPGTPEEKAERAAWVNSASEHLLQSIAAGAQ